MANTVSEGREGSHYFPSANNDAVLNGIAWDEKGRQLLVTGKLWPKLFEIRVVEK